VDAPAAAGRAQWLRLLLLMRWPLEQRQLEELLEERLLRRLRLQRLL